MKLKDDLPLFPQDIKAEDEKTLKTEPAVSLKSQEFDCN
jgi:hypothetical protein